VDPSDLSTLFAGLADFGSDLANRSSQWSEPTDEQVQQAVRVLGTALRSANKPASLGICIQGDWSNVADAKIKGACRGGDVGCGRSPTRQVRGPPLTEAVGVTVLLGDTGASPVDASGRSNVRVPPRTAAPPITAAASRPR
jgi:hypothetical protein